ncbi:response regulator transcription factor [Poseidonibacter lekithochrous]|uniref:response regulator transcription factor n=1 Tax=Poseidonibacter TaxID=2321187 RepID=UPI001C08B9B3|nr:MULTISPECIES: response regulator transcription factor [Poseidonibacter]MBU3015549.1 response regulator transcription factor [Poseidonibacter lekithochrous]MDO6828848.1 response regulator transcription factor [Poseidonibacter sp. 1_MG-2023]
MNKKSKILLLEDDEILAQTMVQILEQEKYEVTLVNDGEEVLEYTYENKFDLYLFDINVPLLNGLETLKLLRQADDSTPTFFITANRDTQTTLEGFDCGCDDYIKKPFDLDELLARIKAILKRKNPIIQYKNITFDLLENRVFIDEEEIALGIVEKEIFSLLIRNINMTVNKSTFFDYMNKPSDSALRVLISKLKKVLDLNISNTKGIGYKLEKV